MTYIFESEQFTLKRVQVALKKKDHNLLAKAIDKVQQMIDAGYSFTLVKDWGKLHYNIRQMHLEKDLQTKFHSMVKQIITKSHRATLAKIRQELPIQNSIPAINPVIQPSDHQNKVLETLFPKPISLDLQHQDFQPTQTVTILFAGDIYPEMIQSIKMYRKTLDNMQAGYTQAVNPQWLGSLSNLYMQSNKHYKEFEGLEQFLSQEHLSGTIILANYGLKMYQYLNKADVDYTIAGIHSSNTSNTKWNVIPLGGSFNIFKCLKCGSESLETNLRDKMLVSLCNTCYLPTYPDLYDIYSEDIRVSPTLWCKAFQALSSSDVVKFIMPPWNHQQPGVIQLILEAFQHRTFDSKSSILHSDNEAIAWWGNKLTNCQHLSYL